MRENIFTTESLLGPLNEVEKKNAPENLFCIGDTSLLKSGKRVSIVGSRDATPEGLSRARALSKELTKEGVIIVSGLALGIDAAAHSSAIQSGGRTIAVIGTPLNESYPPENRELQTQIAREHLLVSQFPEGSTVQKKNFPMRNRTMALISEATVIVEAKDGSGSLHQAWEAIRLGRALFIMESAVNNPNLKWPKEVLHYGASVLTRDSLAYLIEELPEASREETAAFAF